MKKLLVLLAMLVSAVFLLGCSSTQITDNGMTIKSVVDPELYRVQIRLSDDVVSYANLLGSVYGNNSYLHGVIWQDGKGLVRGTMISADPDVPFLKIGDTAIVKTTDRKVMALQPGDTGTFICLVDYEPVCSRDPESNYAVSNCQDMWELDFCRLESLIPAAGR